MPQITTFLTFSSRAEEAAELYVSLFPGARITKIVRYGEGGLMPAGTVLTVAFELDGKPYVAMNGGPSFSFTQGFSLAIECDTQAEIDAYTEKLTAGGGAIVQCGWLTDRFGVSWQVVPKNLPALISDPDPVKAGRAMQAMLGMKKLDIAALERAHAGL